MSWTAYKVILRLRSPLHIGQGKVGNLQRTRSYVTGRNLWGAFTARLTRDNDADGTPAPEAYGQMGQRVHNELAFTYFFPTTEENGDINRWPWDNSFRYTFLSTYAGTALNYARTAAKEASLHEVECITPHTRDPNGEGTPVYLTGYIFQRDGSDLDWEAAFQSLQIGGERGYGWGLVEPVGDDKPASDVFGHPIQLDGERPVVQIRADAPLLAHALAADFDDEGHALLKGAVEGPVEPLVGRETGPDDRFGVQISQARVCYAPGSRVSEDTTVQIGRFGVWERCPEPVEGGTT
jgi:hypothetical protein